MTGPGYPEHCYEHVPTKVTLPAELDPKAMADRALWLAGGGRGTLLPVPQWAPTPDFWPRIQQYEILPQGQMVDPRRPGTHLGHWQPDGSFFLNTRERALDSHDTGAGKTPIAANAIPAGASVIYATTATAIHSQVRKLQEWRPDMWVNKWARKDFTRWPERGEIAVMSIDSLPKPPGMKAKDPVDKRREAVMRLLPYGHWGGILILDEVDNFSTPRTNRRVGAESLASKAGRVWGMSATLMANKPENLKQILKLMGLFRCAFHSEAEFDELTGVQRARELGDRSGRASPDHVSSIVKERLDLVALIKRWKDIGGLEEPRFDRIPVEVDNHAIDVMIAEHGGLARVLELVKRGKPKDIALMSRLRQGIAVFKINVVAEHVLEHLERGEPVVVYSFHRDPLINIQSILQSKNTPCVKIIGDTTIPARNRAVKAYCSGEINVLLISNAGGAGIDLIRKHDIPLQPMLRVDISWRPKDNYQVYGRIRRPGVRWPLLVRDFIADHPFEHYVHDIVDDKDAVGDAMGVL